MSRPGTSSGKRNRAHEKEEDTSTQQAIDEAKLNEFVGSFAGDLGAVLHAATVLIGYILGLYKAMSDGAPVSAEELAKAHGYGRAIHAGVALGPGGQRLRRVRP
jgi:hypothetical protein